MPGTGPRERRRACRQDKDGCERGKLSVLVFGGDIPFASIVGRDGARGVNTLATPEKSAPAYGLPSADFSASILTPLAVRLPGETSGQRGTSSANIGLLNKPEADKEVPDEHGRWLGSVKERLAPYRFGTPPSAAGGCTPKTASGNCYKAGEYCPSADHGATGTDANGNPITCKDVNGTWRWE